ncbi:hypothetical protein HK096_009760, partial [Nowakowskiella sp. JEL0078]
MGWVFCLAVCVICKTVIKPAFWIPHLASQSHKDTLIKLKQIKSTLATKDQLTVATSTQQQPQPPAPQPPKPDLLNVDYNSESDEEEEVEDNHSLKRLKFEEIEPAKDTLKNDENNEELLPDDFFDNPSEEIIAKQEEKKERDIMDTLNEFNQVLANTPQIEYSEAAQIGKEEEIIPIDNIEDAEGNEEESRQYE